MPASNKISQWKSNYLGKPFWAIALIMQEDFASIRFPIYCIISQKIDAISEKLNKNIFLREYKKNSVLFNQEKTILFLYLEKKYNLLLNMLDIDLTLKFEKEDLITCDVFKVK